MKNKIILLFTTCCLFFSCEDGDKYDGLILKDENTNKKYLLKHNILDTYKIVESVQQVLGKDTIIVFK